MSSSSSRGTGALVATVFLMSLLVGAARGQCPWRRAVPELSNMCVCVVDEHEKLSVQCTDANFPLLMTTVHKMIRNRKIDLLYVNDSDIGVLNSRIFDGLHIENIQFSYCRIYNISDQAFSGLGSSLQNLNLQGNRLEKVPSAALAELQSLQLLDLSANHISAVADGAFAGLQLSTLKMGDNDLYLSSDSFQGLEKSLKNLNLKGAGLSTLPEAILALEGMAFLDLAQNEIRILPPGAFKPLHSLAALNLERNLLQEVKPETFFGVNDTLSSLSLLNNLIAVYPAEAINSLSELRVLDIGFNLLEELPLDAFHNVRALTLLALDGNQLTTVPEEPFLHLAGSLKGLSVGGKFLVCDCHVAWIVEWIQNKDLQVTSRERNPQFCGEPAYFRQRSFYQLSSEQLLCNTSSFTVSSSATVGIAPSSVAGPPPPQEERVRPVAPPPQGERVRPVAPPPQGERVRTEEAPLPAPNEITTKEIRVAAFVPVREKTRPPPPPTTTPSPQITSYRPEPVRRMEDTIHRSHSGDGRQDSTLTQNQDHPSRSVKPNRQGLLDRPTHRNSPPTAPSSPPPAVASSGADSVLVSSKNRRPQLVRHPDSLEHEAGPQFGNLDTLSDEVIIQDAYRKDNSVIIQWDSEVSNILGFRVVYRLFGDKQFKLGPPLASSEREFKIRNVPTQECIVVCVVSLEDVNVTPENVPYPQCREIRTEESTATHMDTIIIAASAAICGTVIIALIIFICCNRRRGTRGGSRDGIPSILSHQSAAPLASLGTLGGGMKADWDTLSMYSQRSIPRARMYHMDKGNINGGFTADDVQSHISAASLRPHSRAMMDGQSARSYAGLSAAHLGPQLASLSLSRPDALLPRLAPRLLSADDVRASRRWQDSLLAKDMYLRSQDLRMSRQSLAGGQMIHGYNGLASAGGLMGMGGGGLGTSITGLNTLNNMGRLSRAASTRSRHTRSKSRDRTTSSRLSHAGSSHSLTGYDTDGWTDHDMDIYVARNPTRGGLVHL